MRKDVPTHQFDNETQAHADGDRRYIGQTHAAWNIGANLNGGYLMVLAAAALRQQSPKHPDPLSVTAHYLRPGAGDSAFCIDTQLIRSGNTLTTSRATLSQDGKARIEVLAAFGDLGVAKAARATLPAPAIPPPEQCTARSGEVQGIVLPIMQRLDIRLHPEQAAPGKAGRSLVSGWIRFLDGRAPDSLALLLFGDAFPPSVFGLLGVVGWVPTIELTVHVRKRPAPGWILAQFQTFDIAGDRMIEDGALWDSNGDLVAQSRQLALLRRRDSITK